MSRELAIMQLYRPTQHYETVSHCMLGYVSVVFMIYCAMALLNFFESQLLTETFRGSAQARPKQALPVTSYYNI